MIKISKVDALLALSMIEDLGYPEFSKDFELSITETLVNEQKKSNKNTASMISLDDKAYSSYQRIISEKEGI